MASMGIFSAMMYRQHLHDLIMAKARELNPSMSEEELKTVQVPLPKKVSFTLKQFMQPIRKIIITAMIATEEKGTERYDVPSVVWHCADVNPEKEYITTFEELPNHTMHRIMDLLKPAEPKKDINPTAAMLEELSSVEKVSVYGNG